MRLSNSFTLVGPVPMGGGVRNGVMDPDLAVDVLMGAMDPALGVADLL